MNSEVMKCSHVPLHTLCDTYLIHDEVVLVLYAPLPRRLGCHKGIMLAARAGLASKCGAILLLI